MIVLHRGIDEFDQMRIGYVVKQGLDYFIVNDHGVEHKVVEETIRPVYDKVNDEKISDYPEVFKPTLQSYLASKGITAISHVKAASDEEILSWRGVGEKKFVQIKELLAKIGG